MKPMHMWRTGAAAAWLAAAMAAPAAAQTTLIVPHNSEPRSMSPDVSADPGGYDPSSNVYCHLIVVDWGVSVGGPVYGDLAKSWQTSPDGKTVTFRLHENAKWHDGKPVTSEDVKFTYETMLRKKYPFAAYLTNIERMETPDANTLVIVLKEADASFVPMKAQAAAWTGKIYPKHIWASQDGFDKGPAVNNPVGCGPFKFKEWVRGSHIELVKNSDYFLKPPAIDRLIFKFMTDGNVARAEFDAGTYPYLPYTFAPSWGEMPKLQANPDIEVVLQESHYGRDIQLNMRRKPLDELKVRQAISYAIDRDRMSKLAFNGFWQPAFHAINDAQTNWMNPAAKFPAYDKAMAEKLLDEAGLPRKADGFRFKLSVTGPSFPDCRNMMEVLVQQLREVGVDARLDNYDYSTWNDKVIKGDFDISCYFTRYGPDPDSYREHFGKGGARNFMGYANAEFDKIGEEARLTQDTAARKKMYDRMQAIIVADVPYINLMNVRQPSLVRKGWTGFSPQPSGFNKSVTWFGFYAVTPPK
jgi:peptide/nickel transport system substrate-binding protein